MIVLVSATGDEDVVNPSQEPIETASDPLIIGPAVAAVVLIVIIMQVALCPSTVFIIYNFIHHKVANSSKNIQQWNYFVRICGKVKSKRQNQ